MSKFYLLVAGTRTYSNRKQFALVMERALQSPLERNDTIIIVSGGAKGADALAEEYAKIQNYECKVMPAKWKELGNRAGYQRNRDMQRYIYEKTEGTQNHRGCLCFWDQRSKGTAHHLELSKEFHTPLLIYDYKRNEFL